MSARTNWRASNSIDSRLTFYSVSLVTWINRHQVTRSLSLINKTIHIGWSTTITTNKRIKLNGALEVIMWRTPLLDFSSLHFELISFHFFDDEYLLIIIWLFSSSLHVQFFFFAASRNFIISFVMLRVSSGAHFCLPLCVPGASECSCKRKWNSVLKWNEKFLLACKKYRKSNKEWNTRRQSGFKVWDFRIYHPVGFVFELLKLISSHPRSNNVLSLNDCECVEFSDVLIYDNIQVV